MNVMMYYITVSPVIETPECNANTFLVRLRHGQPEREQCAPLIVNSICDQRDHDYPRSYLDGSLGSSSNVPRRRRTHDGLAFYQRRYVTLTTFIVHS
jgi:hypothetical protein